MPQSFGDFDSAAKMRDIVRGIITAELNKQRPESRVAQVVSINRDDLTAEVRFSGDTGSINARFGLSLIPRDTDAIVRVAGKPGNYYITEIVNQTGENEAYEPVKQAFDDGLLGGGSSSDGFEPTEAPVVTLESAVGFLSATWAAINNPDPVAYRVYVGSGTPLTTDPSTLYATTPATSIVVTEMPNGDPFVTGTTYYLKVVPFDADGDGPVSNEASVAAEGLIIPADYVDLDMLKAEVTNAINNSPVDAARIVDGAIGELELALNAVTNPKIADDAINSAELADDSVINAAIADAAIATANVADSAINNLKVADAAIVNAKIGNLAVSEAKVVDAAITSLKVADAAIVNAKINNLAVDNAKIAALAVDVAKIANLAVTNAKIDNVAVDNAKIANLAVNNAKITDLAVSSLKVADAAILTAKIGDLAVQNGKIENAAINNAKIADLAVNTAKIALLAVGNAQIGNLAVTNAKIADLAVTNAKIDDLAVTNAKIADLAVTNAKVGTLSVEKLAIGNFSNQLNDPNFQLPLGEAWQASTGASIVAGASRAGGPVLRITNNATAQTVYNLPLDLNRIEAGQSVYREFWFKGSVTVPGNGLYIGIRWKLQNGTYQYSSLGSGVSFTAGTWFKFSGTVTAPASTVSYSFYVQSAAVFSTGYVDIESPQSILAVDGSLLVDGALNAKEIILNGGAIRTKAVGLYPRIDIPGNGADIYFRGRSDEVDPGYISTLSFGSVALMQMGPASSRTSGTARYCDILMWGEASNGTQPTNIQMRADYVDVIGSLLRIGVSSTGNRMEILNDQISSYATGSTRGDLKLWSDQITFNFNAGALEMVGNSNIRGKLRTQFSGGTSVNFQDNRVIIGDYGFNAAGATAGNTKGFHAADIHSWTGGLFMEDLAGGGATGANINNAGRVVRTSTRDMKENIELMTPEDAYSVLGLESYTYEFKEADGIKDPRRYPGFIAEQGAEAGAELWVGRQHKVTRDPETGEVTSIERDVNGKITSFRTEAIAVAHNVLIKDLFEELETLKAEVAALKAA